MNEINTRLDTFTDYSSMAATQSSAMPPKRGIAVIGEAIKSLNIIFDKSREKARALSRLSNSLAKASDAMKVKAYESEEEREREESIIDAQLNSIGESSIRA